MSTRSRVVGFGACVVLVIVGVVCALLVPAGAGELLALVLSSAGLVFATGLVFLEVGLSDERARAREESDRRRAQGERAPTLRSGRITRPRLGRERNHRGRLG